MKTFDDHIAQKFVRPYQIVISIEITREFTLVLHGYLLLSKSKKKVMYKKKKTNHFALFSLLMFIQL